VALATVLTDRMWARSTFALHRLLAEHLPTFAYEFADRQVPMCLPFPPDLPPGAFHAAEVPYLFPDDKFLAAATPARRRLSDQLQQSLAPGDGGIRAVDFAADHQLGFWEAAAASSPGMS
jgi:para-nitrobenzyl esterase